MRVLEGFEVFQNFQRPTGRGNDLPQKLLCFLVMRGELGHYLDSALLQPFFLIISVHLCLLRLLRPSARATP